jgi:hypothetical protein
MKKVKELCYHRNGVSGLGFHVGIIKDGNQEMLVIRFPKESDNGAGGVLCAAFDLALLDKRNIKFGDNSWRGDVYAEVIDKEIEPE